MLPNKKIKSFTLAEMMVVLVITGILITIALLVLNLVQKQIKSIENIYTTTTEIKLLERALWSDLNTYRTFYDTNKDQLICASEIDTIIYKFGGKYVLRDSDTITISITKKKMLFKAQQVKGGYIDAIELNFSKDTNKNKIFIFKTNDATIFMN